MVRILRSASAASRLRRDSLRLSEARWLPGSKPALGKTERTQRVRLRRFAATARQPSPVGKLAGLPGSKPALGKTERTQRVRLRRFAATARQPSPVGKLAGCPRQSPLWGKLNGRTESASAASRLRRDSLRLSEARWLPGSKPALGKTERTQRVRLRRFPATARQPSPVGSSLAARVKARFGKN